jgi:hypothetical protein
MLQNTDKVLVENRGNAIVCYKIPESNYSRRFVANEKKEIPMGELRAAVQVPGTFAVIQDDLIIHSEEAVKELFPNAEPEYFYGVKEVDELLLRGSLDQLKDALDFAPDGVIALIQDRAVELKLNDMSKREAIWDQTGFNVTKAIEIKKLSGAEEKVEAKTRRAAPVSATTPEPSGRRTFVPKVTPTTSETV